MSRDTDMITFLHLKALDQSLKTLLPWQQLSLHPEILTPALVHLQFLYCFPASMNCKCPALWTLPLPKYQLLEAKAYVLPLSVAQDLA